MKDVDLQIRQAFTRLRRHSRARQREIAAELGISEARLVAAHLAQPLRPGGARALRLRPDWPGILNGVQGLGRVLALTRNDACVLEQEGCYQTLSQAGNVALMTAEPIDLRFFFAHWAQGFVLEDQSGRVPTLSLQFFDSQGVAVHKIYQCEASFRSAWMALADHFAFPLQTPPEPVAPAELPHVGEAGVVDRQQLRQSWLTLRNPHDFHLLLKRFGLPRLDAYTLAGPPFARRVDPGCAYTVLAAASARHMPLLLFVGNDGALQIHGGPIGRVSRLGPWTNITEPGMNLHLRHEAMASAWVVSKPSEDGAVYSLEGFDAAGQLIAQVFGARQPGWPQDPAWRALLDTAAPTENVCAA